MVNENWTKIVAIVSNDAMPVIEMAVTQLFDDLPLPESKAARWGIFLEYLAADYLAGIYGCRLVDINDDLLKIDIRERNNSDHLSWIDYNNNEENRKTLITDMVRTKIQTPCYEDDQELFFKALLRLCNNHSLSVSDLPEVVTEFLDWAAESDDKIKIQMLEEKIAALEKAQAQKLAEPVAA